MRKAKGGREGPHCVAVRVWDLRRELAKLRVLSPSWELDGLCGQRAELTIPLCHLRHLKLRLSILWAWHGAFGSQTQ